MEEFIGLSEILKEIKKTSKKILKTSYQLMKTIEDEDCELVEDLLVIFEEDGIPVPSKGDLLLDLQNESMKFLGDAEKIDKEIDSFVSLNDEGFNIEAQSEKCPYLAEVWNGDMYDKTDLEGMSELLAELKMQLAEISRDTLINAMLEKYKT